MQLSWLSICYLTYTYLIDVALRAYGSGCGFPSHSHKNILYQIIPPLTHTVTSSRHTSRAWWFASPLYSFLQPIYNATYWLQHRPHIVIDLVWHCRRRLIFNIITYFLFKQNHAQVLRWCTQIYYLFMLSE